MFLWMDAQNRDTQGHTAERTNACQGLKIGGAYKLREGKFPQKAGQSSWKLWMDPFLRVIAGSVLGTWVLKSEWVWLSLVDWWISKPRKSFYSPLQCDCNSSSWEGRVCFFTLCTWFYHGISFVIQAEAWALGLSSLWFLGPPQACPSSLVLGQRLWDAAEHSEFFASPARLTVEPPSSVHPVACPQTSQLNKWLLLVIE